MLIAQISDTHIQAAEPASRARLDDLARTVTAINALVDRPDVVLHTGDVAHDATADDYRAARHQLSRLAPPVLATVGNRDRRSAFRAAFASDGHLGTSADGFVQYAVEIGGVRLVAADTFDEASALGSFCARRGAELASLLAAGASRPTVVFLHHPPVALDGLKGPALQFRDAAEAARLTAIVAVSPGVVGVVAGHVHRSRTALVGRVPLSTMPSIAADLSRELLPAGATRRPVFHLHRVSGGAISTASVVV